METNEIGGLLFALLSVQYFSISPGWCSPTMDFDEHTIQWNGLTKNQHEPSFWIGTIRTITIADCHVGPLMLSLEVLGKCIRERYKKDKALVPGFVVNHVKKADEVAQSKAQAIRHYRLFAHRQIVFRGSYNLDYWQVTFLTCR